MAKKHSEGYLSGKESRRISKENRKITSQLEKQHKRKNVPESEISRVLSIVRLACLCLTARALSSREPGAV